MKIILEKKILCCISNSLCKYATQDTTRRNIKYHIILLIKKWNSGIHSIVSKAPSTKVITLNSEQDWQLCIPYSLSLLPLHCIWQGFGCPHPAGLEAIFESYGFHSRRENKRGASLQNNKVSLYNIQYILHNIGGCGVRLCAIIWTALSQKFLYNQIGGAELLL